ncbi:DNA-binding transcriptional regulator, LysR family [Paenibacillus sp. ov031]|uniref:LysR family transcriptional regulator n=1 Tax=unclassified Paenibacillus TaxID=185978 RepID=UPI00088CD6C1|nr:MULTISPECIES: LysR family transcriptional regulator [unclassified Paenibacillus]SDK53720.1 DNA-binding transcriptional regulator, LysR family [Paenibacillus sp. OK060]SHN61519.1 DNA-binding transcriptional regulator, LysR family [Paenibacillus sp. ov031]
MDIRVLKYFLTVANVGNITKAAEILHITQPTLSRQLMDLEEELGTRLFIRGKRQITLTDSGLLFQQRVKEIISLLDKTERDLAEQKDLIGGVVSIGCVESTVSRALPELLEEFSNRHPRVQYELYSADGDDIREKLDRGNIDIGIFLEPIEAAKYEYIRLPYEEKWGILMRRDDPLAQKKFIGIEDILALPLIPPRRTIVQNEIASWLGVENDSLSIFASHNLLTNAMLLVERKLGYAICVSGSYTIRESSRTCFVPFEPERTTSHVLAWKKNKIFSSATAHFIQFIKDTYQT